MKKKILVSALAASLFLTGCSMDEIKNVKSDIMNETSAEETEEASEEDAEADGSEADAPKETSENSDNNLFPGFNEAEMSEALEDFEHQFEAHLDDIEEMASGGANIDIEALEDMFNDQSDGIVEYFTSGNNSFIELDDENNQVRFTVPFGGEFADSISGMDGGVDVITNADGSVTYAFSLPDTSNAGSMAERMVQTAMNNITESGNFPSVVSVTSDADYTHFEVIVNSDTLDEKSQEIAVYLIVTSAMLGAEDGNSDRVIYVTFVNADTGDVLGTYDSDTIVG